MGLLQADRGIDREYFRSDESKETGAGKIIDHLKDIAFLCILVVLLLIFVFH